MVTSKVSAVVLAHGEEPYLVECVDALLASESVDLEVVLVDNGANAETLKVAASRQGVRLQTPSANLGYAGGCNAGARAASAPVLAFVNSDAIVEPGCLAALVQAVGRPDIGLATASLRLAQSPDLLNSAGNPVHFLGFSWAGAFGEEADRHRAMAPVASVSGATFAVRRDVWDDLGGFDEVYFAYGEDVDLSIRCWERGLEVVFVPEAVSMHHYEFSRNPLKFYLLERNRLVNLLTLYEARTTRWLIAASVPVEVGVWLVAIRGGWVSQKVQGWRWLVDNREYLRTRRAAVQASRVRPDRDIARILRGHLDPPAGFGLSVPRPVDSFLSRYWDVVRRRLGDYRTDNTLSAL